MQIVEQGYIFDSSNETGARRVCHHTTLCRSNDSIYALFRRGSGKDAPDGNCLVARTSPAAVHWDFLSEGFRSTLDGVPGEIRTAELWPHADGSLSAFLTWIDRSSGGGLYDGETDSLLPCRLLQTESTDGGVTWRNYRTLDTGDRTGTTLTGPIVVLPDRGCLVPFESHQTETPGAAGLHGAYALFSTDGKTFGPVITVARHPQNRFFYWDQRHAFCSANHRPVAMFWTYDREHECDRQIHMAWGDADRLEWETPFSTGIDGQICSPIPLPDGRLAAFYVHRQPPGAMRLIVSADGGHSWDHDGGLVVYSKGGQEAGADGKSGFAQYWDDMHAWSFGHPAGLVLDDGTLLLTWYAGPDSTCLSVHWARVAL